MEREIHDLADQLSSEGARSENAKRDGDAAKQELRETLDEEGRHKRAADDADARKNLLRMALKDKDVQAEMEEGLRQIK